jgi:hypothetical protein
MANFDLAEDILRDIDNIRYRLDAIERKVHNTFSPDIRDTSQPILSEEDYEFYMKIEKDKGWSFNIEHEKQLHFDFDSKVKDFDSNDVGC